MRTILLASTAAVLLNLNAAPSLAQVPVCGDVNDSGAVSTADALLVLKTAVGQPVEISCDRCGSTCEGDPRYLLGQWLFESEFGSNLYEDNYDLFAVDESRCEIVGQDLDDFGIVWAWASSEFDYFLLDPNETFCDLFVFDWTGPDEVEGFDIVFDLDEDGNCDFDGPFVEGDMIGERVSDVLAAAARTGGDAEGARPGPSRAGALLQAQTSAVGIDPRIAAVLEKMRGSYAKRRLR